jgi:hypothetical protein
MKEQIDDCGSAAYVAATESATNCSRGFLMQQAVKSDPQVFKVCLCMFEPIRRSIVILGSEDMYLPSDSSNYIDE